MKSIISKNIPLLVTILFVSIVVLSKLIGDYFQDIIVLIYLIGLFIYLLCQFNHYAMILNPDHPNELVSLSNNVKISTLTYSLKTLLIIIVIVCFYLFLEYTNYIPNEYYRLLSIGSFLFFIVTLFNLIKYLISSSKYLVITNYNIKEYDKLVKDYESYILKETTSLLKDTNQNNNITINTNIKYIKNNKVLTRRPKLSSNYLSILVIEILYNDELIDESKIDLITIKDINKNKKEIVVLSPEEEVARFIFEVTSAHLEKNYKYYNSLKDMKKDLKYKAIDNIKYFMLLPEDNEESEYYKKYFKFLETDYKEFKKFLDELGIDYKKPVYMSCDLVEYKGKNKKKYIDTLNYNSIYKGFINTQDNIMETRIKPNLKIGIEYSEEELATLIYIHFKVKENAKTAK